MRRKMWKKTMAAALSTALVLSMAGCGEHSETQAGTEKEAGEGAQGASENGKSEEGGAAEDLVTVTMYPTDSITPSGVVDGYKGKLFAEKGIQLEVWAYSDEKTNAILAGGDLPDIMYVKYDNLQTMIESGMVLNLEEYLD